jgi:hypothetical protein
MPWDSDIDVQVSESAIAFLAAYYNMTVHTFQDIDSEEKEERKYLLEVNPRYKNDSVEDTFNVIDARWIDTMTGLYIDITALRVDRTPAKRRSSRSPPQTPLYCKDKHHYVSTQIFPLRESTFEGVPVKVPYRYQELLVEEYGEGSLIETEFLEEKHFFDQDKMEWVPMPVEMVERIEEERIQTELAERQKERAKMAGFMQSARLRGKKPARKHVEGV